VGGHCGAKEKVGGYQQSYLLYMYRTYVNQMNLNGKLRKKLGGGKQRAKEKSGGGMAPQAPLRIATGYMVRERL